MLYLNIIQFCSSKINVYSVLILPHGALRRSLLHQSRSALMWLWNRQTWCQGALYYSAFGSMLHIRYRSIFLSAWHRCAFGNQLEKLLQQTSDTLQHFILHTFQTTSSSTTVVRPDRFAAFRPSFMRQEWTLSHFPLSVFVLCVYFVQYFEEVSFVVKYCTVIPYLIQKHIFTNNYGGVMTIW